MPEDVSCISFSSKNNWATFVIFSPRDLFSRTFYGRKFLKQIVFAACIVLRKKMFALEIKCLDVKMNFFFLSEAFSATARGNFHRLKEIIEQLGNEFDVDKQYAAGETLLLK